MALLDSEIASATLQNDNTCAMYLYISCKLKLIATSIYEKLMHQLFYRVLYSIYLHSCSFTLPGNQEHGQNVPYPLLIVDTVIISISIQKD